MKRLSRLALAVFVTFLSLPIFGFASTTISSLENSAVTNGGIYNLTKDGSPYIFPRGTNINKDVTINVEPGVEIIISGGFYFLANKGTFNFLGTPEDPITITSNSGRFGSVSFGNGIDVVTVNMQNVNISNSGNCLVLSKTKAVIKNVHLTDCSTQPFYLNLYSGSDIVMDNIKYTKVYNISGLPSTIIFSIREEIDSQNPVSVIIKNSNLQYYGDYLFRIGDHSAGGFNGTGVSIKINNNAIYGPVKDKKLFYVVDQGVLDLPIDARENYWGTESGPYIFNTLPKTDGPALAPNVSFIPFLSRDPSTVLECCSSVIFVPGIQGSRLYKNRLLGGSDQLWEANIGSDLADLYLDSNGNSINESIYTKDVIDKTNLVNDSIEQILNYNLDQNIYKDILDYLQSQKDNNIINSYTAYPYDWRLDLGTIINNGTKHEDGQYIKLVDELRRQSTLSSTGKVTIMAHSMGGLLTKRFIQSLQPADQALVDKVVFIAVPHIGTPEGSSSVLNGLAFTNIYKLVVPQKYVRRLAENMTTAHLLSPSDAYFENVSTSPIVFDSSAFELLPEISTYGSSIDTGLELRGFLSGQDGRIDADFINVNYPNVSPVYPVNRSKELHDELDNYQLPEHIKTVQIVGTGMPTIKQIEFTKKILTQNISEISYKLKKSFSGDGTVVKESAGYLTADTYYINLHKYNTDNGSNYAHKDISGIQPVKDILHNVISNQDVAMGTYISTAGDSYDNINMFTLGMHSPVDVHLYDANGRHTGPVYIEINGEIVRFIEENIPNSEYNEYGESKYIDAPEGESYVLKLDGYDAGTFTLDIQKYTNDVPTSYEAFKDLPATDLLNSTISLIPGLPINSIVLDIDGDSLPDIEARNDGTVIDLNQPPEEDPEQCKKEDKKNKKCKKDKPKENNKKSKKWHEKHSHERNYKNNKT